MLTSCAHWAGSFADKVNAFIPDPVNEIKVVKSKTARWGHIVVEQNGKYYAIDVQQFSHNYYQWKYGEDGWKNVLDYYYNWRHEVWDVGDNRYEGKFSWRTYEVTDSTVKDLEKVGYLQQALQWEVVKDSFVERYALSEPRAEQLATLYQNWKTIKNHRSLTERDMATFSDEIFGLAPVELGKMYFEENEDLIGKAAKVNGITPEHLKELMREFAQ